ncbi:regulator of g protein signaling superfamily [Diplodia corticola]|uniref:Regulator of g protein signaling superfamily n=1 Tax=Diplodia corticola TaxID=236234 RepID=A0A1J9S3Y6_9PEZI|nr:regulator of g protein signaling superfamily [Diplodia corticola]OJD35255.1 regulator of g protein signaling superfamily [Diplodia corticola]
MIFPLTYRRPLSSRSLPASEHSNDEKKKSLDESITGGSQHSGISNGIPDALSFDRIVAGGTCPPCTLREFLNYLKYIELSAENLQFYLWFHDYVKRFEALSQSEKALSPEWTSEQAESEAHAAKPSNRKSSPGTAAVFKGTTFSDAPQPADGDRANPFWDQVGCTPSEHSGNDTMDAFSEHSSTDWQNSLTNSTVNHSEAAKDAFESAGEKFQPFTIQPFREEMSRIVTIYIADGGARQLNLSSRERNSLLRALAQTTHHSAFREVMTSVEWSLRCQAHPHFIRWTICNGNRPRVMFARGLGVFAILGGIIMGILMTLSSIPRGLRALSAIPLIIGISTLIAAYKGMCVVLHGMHHRHVRPWELFTSEDEPAVYSEKEGTRNSYEDEPWVAKYEQRNIVRKIFDREVWIEEPAMRQIQDTIFVQSLIGAVVVSGIVAAIFVVVPKGGFI